jgi:hypothetical protein
MKNLSLALASIGLVGVGFASAMIIYNQFEDSAVTAQQTSNPPQPILIAQDPTSTSSQPTANASQIDSISINSEMAYSLATFCHSYISGFLPNTQGDFFYIRKTSGTFAPAEVQISLEGTCRSYIGEFERQVRNQTSEQVHYDVIQRLN